MNLEEILAKYKIPLKNKDGSLRNVVDILEDFYLKISSYEYTKIMYEVSEEEIHDNVFNNARNGKRYGEDK